MASSRISEHDKLKKELLTLSEDQLTIVTALMLNRNQASISEMDNLLNRAVRAHVDIGEWTSYRVSRALKSLADTDFVRASYYDYKLDSRWSDVAVFAADGLGLNRLDALLVAARETNGYPNDGRPENHWRKNFADITQRCIHKILEGNVKDFTRLFTELNHVSSWSTHAQLDGLQRIKRILAVPDWSFWKKRPTYFRWASVVFNTDRFAEWTEATPPELEKMLVPLLQEDHGSMISELRILAVLGMHHFRHRSETFSTDPHLQGLIAWVNGHQEEAFNLLRNPSSKEDPEKVTPLSLIKLALGNHSPDELYRKSSALKKSAFPRMVNSFFAWVLYQNGMQEEAEEILEAQFVQGMQHPFSWLFSLCAAAWMGIKLRTTWLEELYRQLERGDFGGIPWVEGEIVASLAVVNKHRRVDFGARPQVQGKGIEAGKVLGLYPVKPAWEYALRQLRHPVAQPGKEPTGQDDFRTIWIVDFETKELYCKEQKRGAKGWSKGRKLKWTELLNPNNPEVLHAADTAAIAGLSTHDGRRLSASLIYNNDSLFVDFSRMLYELTEHPRVYLGEKERIPIELLRGQPELQVTESGEGILLRFDPPVEAEGYVWKKETPTRYRVYHLSADQARMAWAIGDGVEVPHTERDFVASLVDDLRPAVAIQSAFDLIDDDLERIMGSPRPCFHLLPFGEGYKVELYVKPLPTEPFYFKPGDGLHRSVVELEDGRRVLERDLELELEEVNAAISACPTLGREPQEMFEWTVRDTTTALRILLELRTLVSDGTVSIEHPKGEKLRIVNQVGANELALRVGKQRDWFEVNGKLTVNEDKVIYLEALLDHLQHNDSNFIELGEGEFVALTHELRDRVLEMEGLLYRKGKKLQLPGLASGLFAELTEDLDDLDFDDAWVENLQRIRKAEEIKPKIPKAFNAELRDYQKEGYRWMMRLAAWGVGGCLADDMGLGKTVQSLAMLTARAARGPALVIAPASVTRNWRRETERFAPALLPILIASRTDVGAIAQLGSGDLALVSYGLLPFIREELEAKEWATIVVDEAQAIKNAATKRAKVVQNLQAEFKLATTGTPIENHLGELWSLFRFLNPGLLGSKSAFNTKYNRPIARHSSEERRSALKNMVKPFILRRRKDQVLTELPPKTEIVLEVNLSEEEKALYEAMRRQAVREIAQADEQQKRFTVLAQLTRLRQAACHPRLVRPNSSLNSAKLELVGETVRDILANGHKALIFSQFVKHLRIVEDWVQDQGMAYQYLDGSTPGKQREIAVNAFQAGEGEVFLISLKAGGTGLNLTAADYVLHLDPWWNPAAEDQASDRAHRIGQQRPVTVYRFVSQGTIEEQIIALHAEKRDLADQILAGTGKSAGLKVEEVLEMITAG